MDFSSKDRRFPLTASILLGGFVFLYLSLFLLPAIPISFWQGDEMTYMFNACRMLHGQVIYRDFFEFTPPGTEVFYFFLFKIAGIHSWIPNMVLIGLGLGIAWLMIVISRKIIPGKAAYLPAAFFLVDPFRSQLDATHHWFSTLFAMAAIALLVEDITPLRLAGAGALCGIAMCFTQSTGLPAILGLALFLLWEAVTNRLSWHNFVRGQLYIWSSFTLVIVLFNAYFVLQAGLRRFLFDTVVFGIRSWRSGPWNTFGAYLTGMPTYHPWYRLPAPIIWLSVFLLVPLIYVLFFVRYWTENGTPPSEPWDKLVLVAITGAMLFLGVAAAPSWQRLCFVAAPGVILFVWFFNTPGRFRSIRVTAAWVAIVVVAFGECGERWTGWHQVVKLPIGQMAIFNRIPYQEIKFLLSHTKPHDYFFGNNKLNYLLELRDPSPIPYVTPSDYTRPHQVQETIRGLEKYPVKYVYWSSTLDKPPEVATSKNHLAPLKAYLVSHYHVVKKFEGNGYTRSFWERLPLSLPPASPVQVEESPTGQRPQMAVKVPNLTGLDQFHRLTALPALFYRRPKS